MTLCSATCKTTPGCPAALSDVSPSSMVLPSTPWPFLLPGSHGESTPPVTGWAVCIWWWRCVLSTACWLLCCWHNVRCLQRFPATIRADWDSSNTTRLDWTLPPFWHGMSFILLTCPLFDFSRWPLSSVPPASSSVACCPETWRILQPSKPSQCSLLSWAAAACSTRASTVRAVLITRDPCQMQPGVLTSLPMS